MPLSLLNHSALALFAQRTRIPTSARSIGFCAIWVCISSSSSAKGSSQLKISAKKSKYQGQGTRARARVLAPEAKARCKEHQVTDLTSNK